MSEQVDLGLAAIRQSAGDEEERQRRRIDWRVGLRRTARLGDIGRMADVAAIDGRDTAGEVERGETSTVHCVYIDYGLSQEEAWSVGRGGGRPTASMCCPS